MKNKTINTNKENLTELSENNELTAEQPQAVDEEQASPEKLKGVVAVEKLNLRAKASIKSAVVTILTSGTELELEVVNKNWYSVTTKDGLTGFVMSEFIQLS